MNTRETIKQMQSMLEELVEMLDDNESVSEYPYAFANDLALVGEMAYSLSEEIQEEYDAWIDEDEFDDDGYGYNEDDDDFDYEYESP